MKVTIVEPIGLSKEKVSSLASTLTAQGHELEQYDDRPDSTEETARRIATSDVAILTNLPMPREVIEAGTKLKFISVAFTGVDHIDLEACQEGGVAVSNAAGFSTSSVAELTIGMIFSALRNIVLCDAAVRKGGTRAGLIGSELRGRSVGIVGTGAIGREVARLLGPFGVSLLGYNRTEYPEAVALGVEYVGLDELVERSDIVTLHLPLTEETRGLISAERIGKMKPGAILINVARGPVVDSKALADALQEERLGAAAIDVFETEPPIPADHPLVNAPRVTLLPHVAFASGEAFEKRGRIVFENIRSWLGGEQQNKIC